MTKQPSPTWWDAEHPDKARALDFVDLAADQIERLAPLLPDVVGVADAVRVACIESFWVNVRLLAEFLVKGTDVRDWQAQDFAPGWTPADREADTRMREAWTLASQHVMHLSKARTPEHLADIEPVVAEDYQKIAQDCHVIYRDFHARIHQ
ncbi:hypothetical protein ABT354_21915 [Streptomyces sp. NPDC000594]|uniref:hypothetical protein n=1 Tax=Streptomyces sp. NPDC000594 TaxID=3154261 RepID=UPI003326A081